MYGPPPPLLPAGADSCLACTHRQVARIPQLVPIVMTSIPPLRRLALCAGALVGALGVSSPGHLFAQTSQAYTWKNVQIHGGGYVSGVVFHPTAQNLIYCRTDVGGAYRWNQAASSWVAINDDLGRSDAQLTGVLSIAVDPNDANRLYLACGQYLATWAHNAAILRSTDRGATWSRTDLTIKLGGNSDGRGTGERLQVDPNLGTVLFLGTNQDGLWKSTDRGVTWARVGSFSPTGVTFVAFDKRSGATGNASQTIFVGINSGSGNSLLRSTNGGSSWAAVAGAPSNLIPNHAELDSAGMLYVSYANSAGPNNMTTGQLWRLNTSNGTWTNISPRVASASDTFGYGAVSVSKSTAGTLVTTTNDRWGGGHEIWRSTNSGATWTNINTLDSFDGSNGPWILWHGSAATYRPHWLTDVDMDPFNNNRVLFVTGGGIWGTDTAFGAAPVWTFRDTGLEETVVDGLISPPAGAPLLSAVGDIGGFRHDNLNATPPDQNFYNPIGSSNSSIDFAQANPAIIVRTTRTAAHGDRSTDGGTTWTEFSSHPAPADTSPGSIAINANATRLLWIPGGSTPFVSTNNGASWTASAGGPTGTFLPVSDRVNANKFYVYDSSAGRVYVSTNGGANFGAAATVAAGGGKLRAVPGLEGNLWLPLGAGGLLRSVNSGSSFAAVAGVQEANVVGFGKAAAGQSHPAVYVGGRVNNVQGIFRSDDVGATWIRINDNAHLFGWLNVIIGDPRVYGRVYLGTGGRGIIYGEPATSSGGAVADGTYRVVALHSGKALDVAGGGTTDGSNVQQFAYHGGDNERWTVTNRGNDHYSIIGVGSGKALAIAGASTADGANVEIQTYTGASNQQWTLTATTGGNFIVTALNSGKALDVAAASTADAANVLQWTNRSAANQQWSFQAP